MKFWRPPYALGKEEDVLRSFAELVNAVHMAVKEMEEATEAFVAGDYRMITTHVKNCSDYEVEADKHRRRLQRALYAGGFMSFSREDRFELSEKIDDVADQAVKAAEWFTLKKIKIPGALGGLMAQLAEQTLATVGGLKRVVGSFQTPVENTISEVNAVEQLRDAVKDTSRRIAEKLFNDRMDPIHVQILWEVVYRITRVADMAEEASDRIGAMAMKVGE